MKCYHVEVVVVEGSRTARRDPTAVSSPVGLGAAQSRAARLLTKQPFLVKYCTHARRELHAAFHMDMLEAVNRTVPVICQ